MKGLKMYREIIAKYYFTFYKDWCEFAKLNNIKK